jgi:hypothetical protein
MDCRTFHRKLEDYLEEGLDFSSRFGMERHAQQCIGCGKEMRDAQQLRQMVSELQRVKAPANFEASVLREIAVRKVNGRFSGLRRFWIYAYEWPSWRKMVLASSSLAVLSLAIFGVSHRIIPDRTPAPAWVAAEPAKATEEAKRPADSLVAKTDTPAIKRPAAAETPRLAKKIQASNPVKQALREEQDAPDIDYVEYMLTTGPDNHPVPFRLPLPKTIPVRYPQMSQEYFIQNVSH